mmetsp:Transcript_35478/g.101065  ORF Transcript_35478/g.101065 Transcript_35478/m.101065 type:complete len:213 (+) Transcript_35478:272-910(+)
MKRKTRGAAGSLLPGRSAASARQSTAKPSKAPNLPDRGVRRAAARHVRPSANCAGCGCARSKAGLRERAPPAIAETTSVQGVAIAMVLHASRGGAQWMPGAPSASGSPPGRSGEVPGSSSGDAAPPPRPSSSSGNSAPGGSVEVEESKPASDADGDSAVEGEKSSPEALLQDISCAGRSATAASSRGGLPSARARLRPARPLGNSSPENQLM